jgi:AraC family transcriptional activator of pyochelin receptor
MTITISQQAYWELFQQANDTWQHSESSDVLDLTWKYPAVLGQGFFREMELHEGLELTITDCQLDNDLIKKFDVHEHPVQYGFLLSGNFRNRGEQVSQGQYWFCGSGLASGGLDERPANQRLLCVNVHIAPKICKSFVANSAEQIAPELLHLFREAHQSYYYRYGKVTTPMQIALQQILHCPYEGVTKRIYLESKVMELLALMVDQEIELQKGKTHTLPLKLDDLDRIHQAKKILLQCLDNPPSLIELARQVGLNDYALKRGFRQVFGKTVFGYLHDYRLEQAQQLLVSSEMKVTEIANAVGFDSRSYFAAAFKKKFGTGPKAYQMQCKNSG